MAPWEFDTLPYMKLRTQMAGLQISGLFVLIDTGAVEVEFDNTIWLTGNARSVKKNN